MAPARTALIVAVSLLLGMVLRILPVPQPVFAYNPDWVLLCLIYWTLAVPDRVGIGTAWFTGLLTDVLTGRMLGQHALAYAVIAFFIIKLHRRMRLQPLAQQAFWVLLFLLVSQILILWTQNIKSTSHAGWEHWLPSVTGAASWPLVWVILRRVRRHHGIT